MAQITILEFLYTRVSMNKFFFRTRFHKSPQEHPSSIGSATALLQGKRGYSGLRRGVLTRFAVEDFFLTSRLTQERRKVQYQRATYKKSIKIRRQVFCPTICSIQGKRRIFMQRATYKGNVPCALNQEFLFFGSRVFEFRSNPSWLMYRLLRDQLYEEAMCKGSTGNGLLNAAKAVP